MTSVLVTGASGFIGQAVLARAAVDGKLRALGVVRRKVDNLPRGVEPILVGDLTPDTHWTQALSGVDVIVHTAARVHVMHDSAIDPLAAFRQVNVAGTLNLARQAIDAGVRRFIFISSIKVNGEGTDLNRPYTESNTPAPVDPYGVSKQEAETGLFELAQSGLEVVVLRPVVVYGPGVKGNFLTLLEWVYKGIPLPLGRIDNKRSFISIQNLADLIICCINHPKALGETFLASDGMDLSTTMLFKKLAQAMNRPARLIPFPEKGVALMARLLGKHQQAQRLLGSLQVDSGKTRNLLAWTPLLSVDEGLRKTAEWYRTIRDETNS